MNKKFIIVSICIFILSLFFILGFNFILGDKILYNDSTNFDQGKPIIKYVGFEEDENVYKIKVSIKNTSQYYASFNDVTMNFLGNSSGSPEFNGYDNNQREIILNHKEGDEFELSYYFNANEEREYIFEISKGLIFNDDIFDTNKISVRYNVKFYRYRVGNDRVIGNVFNRSSTEFLDNSIDPYIIE